jgi:hypothetical protein
MHGSPVCKILQVYLCAPPRGRQRETPHDLGRTELLVVRSNRREDRNDDENHQNDRLREPKRTAQPWQ